MAKTKPKRTPPTAIKTNSMSGLSLATLPELIQELHTRVGVMILGYTEIPKARLDTKKGTATTLAGSRDIEHKVKCHVHGPYLLIPGCAKLVQESVATTLREEHDDEDCSADD